MPHLLLSLEGVCKRCAPLLVRSFDRGRQPRDLSLLILCMCHQSSLAPWLFFVQAFLQCEGRCYSTI